MNIDEKLNFVAQNSGKAFLPFFEKDRELFMRTFPSSKLVPDLLKANEFNKEDLQGRALLELLNADIDHKIILKNRGEEVKADTPKPPADDNQVDLLDTKEEAIQLLKDNVGKVAALDYHRQIKPMIALLEIKTENNQKATFIKALEDFGKEPAPAEETTEEAPVVDTPDAGASDAAPAADTNATEEVVDADKKKEEEKK